MMDCTCGCATGNCPACYACLACCKCHATRPELDALQRDGMASSDLWQQTEQQTEQTEQQTDQTAPRKNSRKQRRARNCTHKAAASAEAVARAARADEATKDEQKKRKVIQKDRDAMKRMGREISWHHKPGWNGLRMSSDTWVVVKVRSAIDLELVAAVQSEIKGMPDSAFKPMGGQQHAFFDQKRRQHQFVIRQQEANHAFIPRASFAVSIGWLQMQRSLWNYRRFSSVHASRPWTLPLSQCVYLHNSAASAVRTVWWPGYISMDGGWRCDHVQRIGLALRFAE